MHSPAGITWRNAQFTIQENLLLHMSICLSSGVHEVSSGINKRKPANLTRRTEQLSATGGKAPFTPGVEKHRVFKKN